MTAPLTLRTARLDAMPLFLAQLARLGLQPLWDAHCPTPGHGVGLSLGWVSVRWVPPLLSAGDHRLHHVAPWAQPRLHTRRDSPERFVPP